MSKVAHGRVLVSQNGTESYRGQSSWSVVLRGQSFFVVSRSSESLWSVIVESCSSWSVVLLARRGLSFFRGQSVFLIVVVSRSSWMVFLFYGGYADVFTETYDWGNRGQCLDKCTGGG